MLAQTDKETASRENNAPVVVECRRLTKIYGNLLSGRKMTVCALKDVSLSVRKGQIIGLIGPNGAGKSTLLNLVAGLITPTEGDVGVCGHPARSIQARRGLGYMPEHSTFIGGYSARATLRYHAALLGLSRQAVAAQVEESIVQLRMQDFAHRPCSDFSQGMKQRLALAIAIMNHPQVLLLDEPSNGLDPIGIVQLRDLLRQLRDSGTSIIISSHRLGELEKLTGDYLFMHRGQVISFAEEIAASQAGRLRVELVSGGDEIARRLLPIAKILSASDTELIIGLSDPGEVPDLVCTLAKGGARITGVLMQSENIEDVFLRLCNERA